MSQYIKKFPSLFAPVILFPGFICVMSEKSLCPFKKRGTTQTETPFCGEGADWLFGLTVVEAT